MKDRKIFKYGWWIALGLFLAIGLMLRAGGLFRGLDAKAYVFHPDEAKQVVALSNYLDGRYLWYVGNRYYDGYPYALNHVDEWILRPVFRGLGRIGQGLQAARPTAPHQPDVWALYTWARSLRVIYGMTVLWLLWLTARRVFPGSPWWSVWTVALLAFSPLSATVTHSATGDVGVDLFSVWVLWALAGYDRTPRFKHMLTAGLATGIAFACKYQGVLVFGAVMAAALLCGAHTLSWRRRMAHMTMALAGGVIGALVATPAFWIQPKRTWTDWVAMVGTIRGYNASAEFLALPWCRQITQSLARNLLPVAESFGWVLLSVALLGAARAAVGGWRILKKRDAPPDVKDGSPAFLVVLALYFMGAWLVSVAGKPVIQLFHFSSLTIPLAILAVAGLQWLWYARPLGRPLAAVALLGMLSELGAVACGEHFFWRKDDTAYMANHMQRVVFDDRASAGLASFDARILTLEDGGLAVFRNRATRARVTGVAEVWTCTPGFLSPTTPWPLAMDWTFDNGPVFPRNDRMFVVEAGTEARRHLIAHRLPEKVGVCLRTGAFPAQVTVAAGPVERSIDIPPQTQQVVYFDGAPARCLKTGGEPGCAWDVPLRIRSVTGRVYVMASCQADEINRYAFWNGESERCPPLPDARLDERWLAEMRRTRFWEDKDGLDSRWGDGVEGGGDLILSRLLPLPCGAYELDGRLELLAEGPWEAEVTVRAPSSKECFFREVVAGDGSGRNMSEILRVRFEKAFVPYECMLRVRMLKGRACVRAWTLRPDAGKMLTDLRAWAAGSARPTWMHPRPGGVPASPICPPPKRNIEYGAALRLEGLELPEVVSRGADFAVRAVFRQTTPLGRRYPETVMCLHLLDDAGRRVAGFDRSLVELDLAEVLGARCSEKAPLDWPTGTFRVAIGVYNVASQKRFPLRAEALTKMERRQALAVFGEITIR